MELNEELVREMVPPIGLVKKVMALIPKVSALRLPSTAYTFEFCPDIGCRNTKHL